MFEKKLYIGPSSTPQLWGKGNFFIFENTNAKVKVNFRGSSKVCRKRKPT